MSLQETLRDAVVVGVDGSPGSVEALAWGAEQAALEGSRLVVAHGEAPHAHGVVDMRVLHDAAARQRPDMDVDTYVSATKPRHMLIEASHHARLLVLGSRGRGALRSVVFGSVGASVMRHAVCPVVVTHHQSARSRSGVLVGADGTEASRPVIEFAFRMASLRSLPLTVVHTTFDVYGSGDLADGTSDTPNGAELRLLLAESVAGFTEKYPDVRVARRIALGLVDDGLVRGLHPWDVVVVGRHPRHSGLDLLSGSTSTSVLERFGGVVAMVPEPEPGTFR